MKLKEAILTPATEIKAFWEEHAGYRYDDPQYGGRARICAGGLDNHLIIATNVMDFATAWLSHDLGTHKYCLDIPENIEVEK